MAVNDQDWVLEEIRARNRQIVALEQTRHSFINYALLLLAAIGAFLGTTLLESIGDFEPVVLLLVGMFFGVLALRYLSYNRATSVMSTYIQTRLLPRLEALYGEGGARLYEWETYIREFRKREGSFMEEVFGGMGVFIIPGLAFFVMGSYKLFFHKDFLSTSTIFGLVVFCFCLWLIVVGIRIGWRSASEHGAISSDSSVMSGE